MKVEAGQRRQDTQLKELLHNLARVMPARLGGANPADASRRV